MITIGQDQIRRSARQDFHATKSVLPWLCAFSFAITACSSDIVILSENTATGDAYEAVADSVGKSIGVRVKVVKLPYEKLTEQARTDFSSGTGAYDIVLGYNTELPLFTNRDWVVPLSQYGKMQFGDSVSLFSSTWREVGYYGRGPANKAVGIPFSANTMLLAYNAQLFDDPKNRAEYKALHKVDLAVPATWAELLQVAQFFNRPRESIYGIALHGASQFIYYEWANIAYSMGGGVMRKSAGWDSDLSTPLILGDSLTAAATLLYSQLWLNDPAKSGGEISRTYPWDERDSAKQRKMFAENRIAMALMWSDEAFRLKDIKGIRFSVIPGNKSMLAGGAFFVSKASRNKAKAIVLIDKLLSVEAQRALVLRGLCSPVRAVYDDSAVVAGIPYATSLKQSLDRGVYMLEAGPDADTIIRIISESLRALTRLRLESPEARSPGLVEIRSALEKATASISAERVKLQAASSQPRPK